MFCAVIVCHNRVSTFFNASTYVVYNDSSVDWYTAVGKCAEKRGHLASISTMEEFNAIASMLVEFFNQQSSSSADNYGVWVDGNDDFEEGDWYCAFQGDTCGYFLWGPGYPRTSSSDCIRMYAPYNSYNSYSGVRFRDQGCTYTYLGSYVCEYKSCHG